MREDTLKERGVVGKRVGGGEAGRAGPEYGAPPAIERAAAVTAAAAVCLPQQPQQQQQVKRNLLMPVKRPPNAGKEIY